MELFNTLISRKIITTLGVIGLLVLNVQFEVYAEKMLTVNDAVNYAHKASSDYRNQKNSLATKRIQLTQAREAIKDARKKESTVRFSLLFNIKFPEKHAMPKEIELIMKVPKIEVEIKNLNKSLEDIKLSDQNKTESNFLKVYEYIQKSQLAQSDLDVMNNRLSRMKMQLNIGKAKQTDVTDLENAIKAKESLLAGYKKNLESSKEQLSELVGFDVSKNYIFKNPLQKVDIDRRYLNDIINYTLNNDVSLFQAQNSEALARRNVDEIYQIYGNKWGKIVKNIESDVRSNSDLDFNQFLDKYNKLLNDIDKPWNGNYTIKLLFFKIKIPKEWFKGEYDGQRYFEDEKYALFVALKEKEDAINQTKAIKKELTSNIKNDYELLKDLWRNYEKSVESTKQNKIKYERMFMKNKIGQADFGEVEAEKSNYESAQATEFDDLIAYNQQLIAFNKLTCGSVDALRKNVDIFLESVASGDSMAETEELMEDNNSIIYYINNVVDQKRVTFGLHVPSKYKDVITHYEILTPEKVTVANKTEIGKDVSILPIEYKGTSDLLVRLYNNDDFIDEATFDAMYSRGKLQIKKVAEKSVVQEDNAPSQKTLGTYDIIEVAGNYVKKIRFNIAKTSGVSFYKIVDNSQGEIGEKNKFYAITDAFSYLGFALNDLSQVKINLYDANHNLKFIANFDMLKKEIVVDQ